MADALIQVDSANHIAQYTMLVNVHLLAHILRLNATFQHVKSEAAQRSHLVRPAFYLPTLARLSWHFIACCTDESHHIRVNTIIEQGLIVRLRPQLRQRRFGRVQIGGVFQLRLVDAQAILGCPLQLCAEVLDLVVRNRNLSVRLGLGVLIFLVQIPASCINRVMLAPRIFACGFWIKVESNGRIAADLRFPVNNGRSIQPFVTRTESKVFIALIVSDHIASPHISG